MNLINHKEERTRFVKFAIVGLTGTAVDFGLMNLFRLVFLMPLVWAQAISFILAVINNFLWNRYWTYPESRTKGASKQLIQFILINVIGISIRTPLVPWADRIILNMLNNSGVGLPLENFIVSQNLALAVSTSIILIWNFFANRYWTYGNVPIGERNSET